MATVGFKGLISKFVSLCIAFYAAKRRFYCSFPKTSQNHATINPQIKTVT